MLGDLDLRRERFPVGERVGHRAIGDALCRPAGDQGRGVVPEPNHALLVDEEDALADCVEDVRGLLALGRDGARRRLGGFEPEPLGVQARVPLGRAHQGDEPLDDLELLGRELGLGGHHLDDADRPCPRA